MMDKLINSYKNRTIQGMLMGLLILYQVIRLITFINVYGGLEHDSGWFLGMARSLAERGAYTSLVSTIQDPALTSGYDFTQEFFQIQDETGKLIFMVGSTVGPAQIIPDAIIIKAFGSGFWQFRTASLLYYAIFLALICWLLYAMSGMLPALLFLAVIFLYPHLSIFLGYEALAEVPLAVYLLLSYVLFAKAAVCKQHQHRWFFLSGVAAALAILSKVIALIPLSSLGLVWLIFFVRRRLTFVNGMMTAAGALVVLFIWEAGKFVIIVRDYGTGLFVQHMRGRIEFFTLGVGGDGGSQTGSDFFWYKFFLISEISHTNATLSAVTLSLIFAGGPFLIWYYRSNRRFQMLALLLWAGWLTHTSWFLMAAKSGWVRRYWVALILGVILLSLLWGALWHYARSKPGWISWCPAVLLTLVIGLNFSGQLKAATFFISDALVDVWYQKHLSSERTRVPWSLVPRKEQRDLVDFIALLPESTRLFYTENHKSAEVATLTGRMLYPIQRRPLMDAAGDDVIVVGPSLISPWTKLMERPMTAEERDGLINGVRNRIKQECPRIAFENDYYIICALN